MKIGYARCSTGEQDHTLQIDALTRAGCDKVFVETASGTRADRPVLAEALAFARSGDEIAVYSLSRAARSVRHLMEIADTLRERNIGLISLTESIDTGSPSGRFLFVLLSALSQLEVELLRERTAHGLQAARARVGGRPKVLDETKLTVARTLLADGSLTVAEIAKQVGCGPATLYRHLGGGRRALARGQ
jgi:DNA invertase Pin-like site-specific DNA recombinase